MHTRDITARTFHASPCTLFSRAAKSLPSVNWKNDTQARQAPFIKAWRQCSEKKCRRKGDNGWKTSSTGTPEGSFWQDEKLARRLGLRLDRWVSLMRMHGGTQAEMIESAPE